MRRVFKHAWIEAKGVGGTPRTVAERAIKRAKELGSNRTRRRPPTSSYEEQDQVWVVFDRDNYEQFENVVDMCRSSRVGIARSNPCFEVWLVLHLADYDKPTDSRAIQAWLHQLFPTYDHDRSPGPDFERLLAGVQAAEQRAATQLRARETEQQPFGNPSTTVGSLTRTIRGAHEAARRRHSSNSLGFKRSP